VGREKRGEGALFGVLCSHAKQREDGSILFTLLVGSRGSCRSFIRVTAWVRKACGKALFRRDLQRLHVMHVKVRTIRYLHNWAVTHSMVVRDACGEYETREYNNIYKADISAAKRGEARGTPRRGVGPYSEEYGIHVSGSKRETGNLRVS